MELRDDLGKRDGEKFKVMTAEVGTAGRGDRRKELG